MEVKAAGMLAAGAVLVGIFFTCSVCFVLFCTPADRKSLTFLLTFHSWQTERGNKGARDHMRTRGRKGSGFLLLCRPTPMENKNLWEPIESIDLKEPLRSLK